jgi:uncharacterized DUF497 family protein
MEFEWDDTKAHQNKVKHGISFEVAALTFEDEAAIILEDDRSDYGEIREILIGRPLSERQCLLVVFTERDLNLIRIISARKATRAETKLYYEQNG